ncbi:MAG: hypothetical protein NT170_04980 [Candidatus Moranbacteria bacterium]|nr:hypothetical protein [Candidatus Moranbacteria bacterium]
MANKKEDKTKVEAKKVAPPSDNPDQGNQPQKKNGCLWAAVIMIAVFLLIGAFILIWLWPFIFSFILDLRSGDFSLPKTTQTSNSTLKGKNLSSLVDPSKTTMKRIIAKTGGQITTRTANGLYFNVNIGPGSLEKDTDITLTPINESPIENYPDPSDPGVVIGPDNTNLGDDSTVTVSEDPPTNPGGSGTGPATNPDGGTTTTPPTPPNTPPNTPPTVPPDVSGSVPGLGDLLGQLGRNTIPTTPSGNPSGQGSAAAGNTGTHQSDRDAGTGSSNGSSGGSPRFTGTTVIIFTGYGGGVSVVPAEPSDDGISTSGPIDQTGAASTDNPDPNESQNLANNAAAASGGTCSPEFLQTMANAAQAGGAGSSAAQSALRDCFNTEWLNNLCVNDPVKLRRTYFEQRIALARRFDERAAGEIESLMNQCQARYHFYGEGINPASTQGMTIFSSLDANVCGYVDDEWTGTQIYQLSVEGGGHYFGGTANFKLPPGGGEFTGISHGSNDYTVAGRRVEIPNFDFGFIGHFDGYKTILDLNLYPATIVSARPIELQEKSCVPVAPLPR